MLADGGRCSGARWSCDRHSRTPQFHLSKASDAATDDFRSTLVSCLEPLMKILTENPRPYRAQCQRIKETGLKSPAQYLSDRMAALVFAEEMRAAVRIEILLLPNSWMKCGESYFSLKTQSRSRRLTEPTPLIAPSSKGLGRIGKRTLALSVRICATTASRTDRFKAQAMLSVQIRAFLLRRVLRNAWKYGRVYGTGENSFTTKPHKEVCRKREG